ncbi:MULTISPECIES: hypothetical protein [unclassified Brevibacterium]|uniref:hypothetical protein n=1 Tax=unclassified Brevibacterium TaxID=2614124 RepID=UPI00108016D0|nr:hypothetical protein [Brevibacterium sp. S111]TGD12490.1 hypothetical protein EB836_05315 [Brevibacterium sp. S111]
MAKACVNNLFVSLDGFAAGEFVTFDQPIGQAQALFSYFDGRGIWLWEGLDGSFDIPALNTPMACRLRSETTGHRTGLCPCG